MDSHQIFEAVRAQRVKLGITVRELAKRAGLHRRSVDAIISGEQNPDTVKIRTLLQIAQALGMDVVLSDSAERERLLRYANNFTKEVKRLGG